MDNTTANLTMQQQNQAAQMGNAPQDLFWTVYDNPENDGMGTITLPCRLEGFVNTTTAMSYGPNGQPMWLIGGYLNKEEEAPLCPHCKKRLSSNGTIITTLRHVPIGNIPTCIGVRRTKYRCENKGCYNYFAAQPIPFKEPEHRITTELGAYIRILLGCGFNLVEVSEITAVGRNIIKDIDKKRLQDLYMDGEKLKKPPEFTDVIGIDEFLLHNGRIYATIVVDLRSGHILWVRRGKSKKVVYDFIEHVGLEWMSHVKAISCDMNSDFCEAFKEKCPHLKVVFDHFHIVKNLNEKVIDEVRKDEVKRLEAEGKTDEAKQLKGSKYILYMSKETREEKDAAAAEGRVIREGVAFAGTETVLAKGGNKARYDAIIQENSLLFTCDLIKEKLALAYQTDWPPAMGRYIRSIIQLCNDSGNVHLLWFGRMLENHMDGIIAHATFHIANGILEGTNRKIKTVRREAYGLPDDEYFFLKIIDASYRPSYAENTVRKNWPVSWRVFNTIM